LATAAAFDVGGRETKELYMKSAFNIVGILLALNGAIWLLQGINIMPGSFMSGQTRWAIYGGLSVIVGVALLLWANRRQADVKN
jgi:hypothetical protein